MAIAQLFKDTFQFLKNHIKMFAMASTLCALLTVLFGALVYWLVSLVGGGVDLATGIASLAYWTFCLPGLIHVFNKLANNEPTRMQDLVLSFKSYFRYSIMLSIDGFYFAFLLLLTGMAGVLLGLKGGENMIPVSVGLVFVLGAILWVRVRALCTYYVLVNEQGQWQSTVSAVKAAKNHFVYLFIVEALLFASFYDFGFAAIGLIAVPIGTLLYVQAARTCDETGPIRSSADI